MDQLNKRDASNFSSLFSEELKKIFHCLFDSKFNLMFVGGCTRNYLLNGTLAYDLDAELRPQGGEHVSLETWTARLEELKVRISMLGHSMDHAGVGVFKIKLADCDLEFSTPRTERFIDGQWGHSNFDVSFNPNLSTKEAFERRDFTMNAIGFLLSRDGVELEDPFDGLKDLEDGVLSPVSQDFHRDPVRILRALRFSLSLGFVFGDKLLTQMELANFSELTNHYISLEANKVGALRFLAFFQKYQQQLNWVLPKSLTSLNHFDLLLIQNSLHTDPFHIFCLLFGVGAKLEDVRAIALVFGFKQKEIKAADRLISRFASDSEAVASEKELQKLKGMATDWQGPIASDLLRKLSYLSN